MSRRTCWFYKLHECLHYWFLEMARLVVHQSLKFTTWLCPSNDILWGLLSLNKFGMLTAKPIVYNARHAIDMDIFVINIGLSLDNFLHTLRHICRGLFLMISSPCACSNVATKIAHYMHLWCIRSPWAKG